MYLKNLGADLRVRAVFFLVLAIPLAAGEKEVGQGYLDSGRVAEAARIFDKLIAERPADREIASLAARCHFQLGMASFNAGDYPAAVKAFGRAAALNVPVPRLFSQYGRALLFTGDPDGAIAAFRRQLASDPNDYPATFHLAEILLSRKRFTEAEPLLRRAAALRPDSSEAQLALADAEAARSSGPAGPQAAIAPGNTGPAVEVDGVHLPLPDPGRPAVLVFGSYTCPNFRKAAAELNRLASAYGRPVSFLLVYIREAHSDDRWQSTINEREKVALSPARSIEQKRGYARLCTRKLKMSFPAVVDGMDGAAENAYTAWPSRVYVIGTDGRVRYASGLTEQEFDAGALERAVRESSDGGGSR